MPRIFFKMTRPFSFIRKQRLVYLKTQRKHKSDAIVPEAHYSAKQEALLQYLSLIFSFLTHHLGQKKEPIKKTLLRILLLIVSALWFATYPSYLFSVYMYEKGFFSYDFFSQGIFGLTSFYFFVVIVILIATGSFWGFMIAGKKAYINYIKNGYFDSFYRIYFWVFLLVAIFIHSTFFWVAVVEKNSFLPYTSLVIFSFAVSWYATTFIRIKRIEGAINWVPSAIFIVFTAAFPLFLGRQELAYVIDKSLQAFYVGGGKHVTIYATAKNGDEHLVGSGKLLLWAPDFVYFVTESNKHEDTLHAYPTKGETHIIVDRD